MNHKPSYAVRLAMTALLSLLTMVSAMAQRTVYVGTTTMLDIVQAPGDSYKWELYSDPSVDFAKVPGNCPPSSARFVGTNTGPVVNVEWLLPGIYFYKVTAWNASGCTNNLKVGMLKVIPHDLQAVIAGADQTGACQRITLDGSGSVGNIVKYQWSVLDPGAILSNKDNVKTEFALSSSFTGTLPAQFRISLQVTNQEGQNDTDTVSVVINQAPIAGISSSLQPERDGSMIVDGSVSIGTGLSYKWTTAEGKIVGATDKPTAFLLGSGIYTLEVTDAFGCKSVKTFNFPIELYKIIANPDHARTTWAQDTTIIVLNNDKAIAPIIPNSVRVIVPPAYGEVKVKPDGTVTYTPTIRKPGRDYFIYEVCDAVNLCDSALVTIDISDAGIDIIEGFSPNGDGQNDQMVFKGLEHYPKSHIHVYTRSGQLVYQSDDYLNDWGGRNYRTGEMVPTGVYYYVLELGGTTRVIKGFVYIGY